jgi:hypothetical protein
MEKSLLINTREYGFFSSMFQILDNIKYCEQMNIKPILSIGEKFLYKGNNEKCWNNFYEDINDGVIEGEAIEITKLTANANFLVENFLMISPQNHNYRLKLWELHCQNVLSTEEHRKEINGYITKYLKPVKHIQDEVENFREHNFKGSTLGVHVRGSDYGFHNLDVYETQIRLMLNTHHYSTIFVASDNTQSINSIKSKFPNVCFYETPLRVENLAHHAPVCHTVSGEDCIKQGQDVLIEAQLLGHCDRLISINSNVAAMGAYLNPSMPLDLIHRQHGGG